ncbi:putative uncharacterized protein [Rhodococcus sp. AW25M09]|uniref:hypothetical protein n=1 Tax=Rhodococcus sp. AW25M09 TaxID=1268303 RepID=UPI0002ABABAA|nr:hypothetical protein [Rhodococcus sp. AW25M09]CCQ16208.1 putative uncharacterized protein [Rhodococcus sp. AW25M09]
MTVDAGFQVGRWRSLLLWMRGRHAPVSADSTVFTATRGTLAMPLMFGAATVIEMAVLHLLIPWLWLSAAVAALSMAALVALASSIALARVHPHVLSAEALTLRTSGTVVATVNRASIASARIHRRYGVVSPALDEGRLVLPNQDGTNVAIELSVAIPVLVPAILQRWQISGTAHSLSLQVDDPAALVASLTRSEPPLGADRPSRTFS